MLEQDLGILTKAHGEKTRKMKPIVVKFYRLLVYFSFKMI